MSGLAPLLEIQELDLAGDAARLRSAELPARSELPTIQAQVASLEANLTQARTRHAQIRDEEEAVGSEVAQIARDIEAAEVARYSGSRKSEDEAATHEDSQARLRDQQASLEEREMELLESLESAETQIHEYESTRATLLEKQTAAEDVIDRVEAEVAVELRGLETQREKATPPIPPAVLTAYERIRAQQRSLGRGAAALRDESCAGCRLKLPSVELTRMLKEPDEALIQCPQCRRVLVR